MQENITGARWACRRQCTLALCGALLLAGSGCAKWFPGKVAAGIARLTVRNSGAILKAVNADETCGFSSPGVTENQIILGNVGEMGTVIWKVDTCPLDFGSGVVTSTDCHGETTTLSGKITVSAEIVVTGRLTGNAETPIVPDSPSAATIMVSNATFDNFLVKTSGTENALTMIKGSLSLIAIPTLAKDIARGVCSEVIPVVNFQRIAYGPSQVYVEASNSFTAEVQSSNYSAQSGLSGDTENTFSGTLTVWDNVKDVAKDGDGLDPEYVRTVYQDSYTCSTTLALPVDLDCRIHKAMGGGAARLSMRTLGGITSLIANDTTCGFESPEVLNSRILDGDSGRAGGTMTYTVENCEIDLGSGNYTSEADCSGSATQVTGRVIVSATKVAHGILTGGQEFPLVPTDWDPVTFNIQARLYNVAVRDSQSDQWMVVEDGALQGNVTPRIAVDKTTKACSVPTSVAQLSNVVLEDAKVSLHTDGIVFKTFINSANLYAVNGFRDGEENLVHGQIAVEGETVVIDSEALQPTYNPIDFADAFSCRDDVRLAARSEDCDFTGVLAQATARLLVRGAGIAVKAAQGNEVCGFTAISGLLPQDIVGTDGTKEVDWIWDIADCTLQAEADGKPNDTDCHGTELFLSGHAFYNGTKKVTGMVVFPAFPPLQPKARESVFFVMDEVRMHDFKIAYYDKGETEPAPYMVMHNGTMRGRVDPIMAESESVRDRYFIAVGTADYRDITIVDSDITIYAEDMQFKLRVDEAYLNAYSGAYLGRANELSGHVVINGTRYEANADGDGLDPSFDLDYTVKGYECLDDLFEPLPIDGYTPSS